MKLYIWMVWGVYIYWCAMLICDEPIIWFVSHKFLLLFYHLTRHKGHLQWKLSFGYVSYGLYEKQETNIVLIESIQTRTQLLKNVRWGFEVGFRTTILD